MKAMGEKYIIIYEDGTAAIIHSLAEPIIASHVAGVIINIIRVADLHEARDVACHVWKPLEVVG